MAETKAPAARPLSPHLQIYRLTMTMKEKIERTHRLPGTPGQPAPFETTG